MAESRNEMVDSLDQMEQSAAQSDTFQDAVDANQQFIQLQQEWLERTPEENLELLNAESADTGVYGFSYVSNSSQVVDIPGMTKVEYSVPGDPNGGSYVGYESYEQTYEKAKEAYQEALSGGDPSQEAEEAFAEATATYSAQKSDYENYLKENPTAPDYLQSENPVSSYAEFDTSSRLAEQFQAKEKSEANYDIDMDAVQEQLDAGKEGVVMADTASVSGQYAEDYQSENGVPENTQQYAVRLSDTIPETSIRGMQNYQAVSGTSIPEITAEQGTDEYGQQLVERMKAIDADMASANPEYESMFPENMRYYSEGENPQAIPGMTLVVGKIEGLDGYYAGYESYDETYSHSLATLDERSASLESSGLSEEELVSEKEQLAAGYNSANELYDTQKTQYDSYVDEHPGNDFLEKQNAVDAYNTYNDAQPAQQKIQDTFANIKDWLENALEKANDWVKALGVKLSGGSVGMSDAEAAQTSSDYWAERAALEPDNQEIQTRAVEASMKNAELNADADVNYGNRFNDIVQQAGTSNDVSYSNDGLASESKDYGSTGNQLLDELSHGSTQTVDDMVMSMPDAASDGTMETYGGSYVESDYGQIPVETQEQQQMSSASPEISQRLADLEARLAKGAQEAQQEADGPSFSSFGK